MVLSDQEKKDIKVALREGVCDAFDGHGIRCKKVSISLRSIASKCLAVVLIGIAVVVLGVWDMERRFESINHRIEAIGVKLDGIESKVVDHGVSPASGPVLLDSSDGHSPMSRPVEDGSDKST